MNCKVIVVAGSVALAGIGCAGCGRGPSSPAAPLGASTTSPSTGNAHGTSTVPSDYTRLLISPQDVLAPNDSYSGPPPTLNPNGTAGAQVLFINRDQTRALGDSIVILPDVAAAPSALQQAEASLGPSVMGGTPEPSPVGTGGTVVSGMSPDQSKEVTILLFTEGRAFARMEFDSAPGEATSQNFVTDGGQKQDIALRVGLST